MRPLPETAGRADWPRLVAGKVNRQESRLAAAEAAITALQAAIDWSALVDYADDAAAAAGGLAVGALYRTGSTVKVRVA